MTRLRLRNTTIRQPVSTLITDQPEVVTWIANVIAAGGSVSYTNRVLANQFISDLKVDGTLSTIQRMFVTFTDTFDGSLVPLIDTLSLGNFTHNGFTASQWLSSGLAGTGTTHVNTLFIPNTHLSSFSSCCVWTNFVLDTGGSFPRLWGVSNGARRFQLEHNGSSSWQARVYSDTDNVTSGTVTSGDIVVNRSSATLLELILNGSIIGSNGNTATDLRPTFGVSLFGEYDAGSSSVINKSQSRIFIWSIGSSMTSGQRTTMRNAIASYKAAKGI